MNTTYENVFAEGQTPTARTSSIASITEGKLCEPPALVQQHWAQNDTLTQDWLINSPVSDPSHELIVLRDSFRKLNELLANLTVAEPPELFEMPVAPKIQVRMRVGRIRPATFAFVDELAEDVPSQDK